MGFKGGRHPEGCSAVAWVGTTLDGELRNNRALGCALYAGILIAAALAWMITTNAAAPKRQASLDGALKAAGYDVLESYPGARGRERCGRHSVQYIWKARTADGEACVSRDGVRIINVQMKGP